MQGVRTVAEEMRQRFEGQPLAECNIILASSYRKPWDYSTHCHGFSQSTSDIVHKGRLHIRKPGDHPLRSLNVRRIKWQ
jgi:hypothetical protein